VRAISGKKAEDTGKPSLPILGDFTHSLNDLGVQLEPKEKISVTKA